MPAHICSIPVSLGKINLRIGHTDERTNAGDVADRVRKGGCYIISV